MITKILSGGQTGSDRAALDAAITLNIPHGGWCPKGRLAELGSTIPLKYSLLETDSSEYSERTKLNIRDSDGTLIFVPELPLRVTDGTVLTIQEIKEKNKPFFILDIRNHSEIEKAINWIEKNSIKTLNVAGPRESQSPGIYNSTFEIMKKIISCSLTKELNSNISQPGLGNAR